MTDEMTLDAARLHFVDEEAPEMRELARFRHREARDYPSGDANVYRAIVDLIKDRVVRGFPERALATARAAKLLADRDIDICRVRRWTKWAESIDECRDEFVRLAHSIETELNDEHANDTDN